MEKSTSSSLSSSSSSITTKRLQRELKEILNDPPAYVTAGLINENNIYEWEATIIGPSDTPYEGGIFKLLISFTNEYPYRPPKVRFMTRIFHPNISPKGDICLDILRDSWSPALTTSRILLSVCSLLGDPNPNDPLVPEIATIYKDNYELYLQNARKWTMLYANEIID